MADADTKNVVTFISKCSNQGLWYGLPRRPEKDALGRTIDSPGTFIEFEAHRYETDDPTEIEGIRKSDVFNIGVWEEGNAPDEPKPTVKAQLKAIRQAARAADADAIQAVVDEENATHKREIVLEAAKDELAALAEGDSKPDKEPVKGPESKEPKPSQRTSTPSERVSTRSTD